MRFDLLTLDEATPAGYLYPKEEMLAALGAMSRLKKPLMVYLGENTLRNAAGTADLAIDGDLLVAEVDWLDTPKGRVAKELCELPDDVRLSLAGYCNFEERDGVNVVLPGYEFSHLSMVEADEKYVDNRNDG